MDFTQTYLNSLKQTLSLINTKNVNYSIELLRQARDRGSTIFVCGNGGSACIASQMVCDLVKGASYQKKSRFKAICLSDNIGTITAYANDVGYDTIFEEQLKNFAKKDDIVIGISGSGMSKNVLNAITYANDIDCKTIGLTNSTKGYLRDFAKIPIVVPETHMGRLEDCFFVLTHILCYAFMED